VKPGDGLVERPVAIRNELIDELLAAQDPSSVMRQDGLLGELKKALLNRLMAAGFDHHLTQDRASNEDKNHRNGSSRKRVLTDDSQVDWYPQEFFRSPRDPPNQPDSFV
jgi:putative transposase